MWRGCRSENGTYSGEAGSGGGVRLLRGAGCACCSGRRSGTGRPACGSAGESGTWDGLRGSCRCCCWRKMKRTCGASCGGRPCARSDVSFPRSPTRAGRCSWSESGCGRPRWARGCPPGSWSESPGQRSPRCHRSDEHGPWRSSSWSTVCKPTLIQMDNKKGDIFEFF